MILKLFFVILVLHLSFAVHAPTWNSCNCYWEGWKSWSQCSSSCGGGTQTRDRSVWNDDVPECKGFEKCASNDEGYERQACNTNCFNGGTFRTYYSIYGSCDCPPGKTGSCCEQTIDCGHPSTISHGSYTGTDFTYNHSIQYRCDNKYNMTDLSQSIRTCSLRGYWTGTSPVCLYATSCESQPCKNGAMCVNLLGDYKCQCTSGWSGKNCEIDVQPPVVSNCPSDINVHTADLTSKQTWTEPIITDPHNTTLHITRNYPKNSFEFPWGEFTVQYEAVKVSNGLKAECVFNISIKPFPCKPLLAPENGILACNGWRKDYSQVCTFICKDNFSLPYGIRVDDVYVCGATGHWLPANPVEKCVSYVVNVGQEKAKTFSCADKLEIAKYYIDSLEKSALNALCLNYANGCTTQNVEINC